MQGDQQQSIEDESAAAAAREATLNDIQTPNVHLHQQTSSSSDTNMADGDNSPHEILASFFKQKGGTPLTPIEMEGVMSLMKKTSEQSLTPARELSPKPQQQQPPPITPLSSYVSNTSLAPPLTTPYKPVFTPSRITTATLASAARTRMPGVRPYSYGASSSTPFRRRRPLGMQLVSTPTTTSMSSLTPPKYHLSSVIDTLEPKTIDRESKRELDVIETPQAKRRQMESVREPKPPSKTATLISSILDNEPPILDSSTAVASFTEFLNPYASHNGVARSRTTKRTKPQLDTHQTPPRKERSAIETIEHSVSPRTTNEKVTPSSPLSTTSDSSASRNLKTYTFSPSKQGSTNSFFAQRGSLVKSEAEKYLPAKSSNLRTSVLPDSPTPPPASVESLEHNKPRKNGFRAPDSPDGSEMLDLTRETAKPSIAPTELDVDISIISEPTNPVNFSEPAFKITPNPFTFSSNLSTASKPVVSALKDDALDLRSQVLIVRLTTLCLTAYKFR